MCWFYPSSRRETGARQLTTNPFPWHAYVANCWSTSWNEVTGHQHCNDNHHWCTTWFPQEVFLWTTTHPHSHSRRPCRWNWQRWPNWCNPTGLLKSLWHGPTKASQSQDQEMEWGLPHQKNSAGGSKRQTSLHGLNHLRCTLRLHPRAISLLEVYQWPWWY